MKNTPLFPVYAEYGAKIIDFHGWNLPVQFSGIIDEHQAVRRQAGLFDVSHMGEIRIQGPDAGAFLDFLLTNTASDLEPGFVRYSPVCYEDGGTVDDILIYRQSPDEFLLVVNASNIEKDYDWIVSAAPHYRVQIDNLSENTAQLAIQGPLAVRILEKLTTEPIVGLKYYQFIPEIRLGEFKAMLSRTGYTGEDGFELYLSPDAAVPVWEILMKAGKDYGLKPIGLGARDTLRLEAGLPLYGNELSSAITPLEAGLNRFIKFSKDRFLGKESLMKPPLRRLIGLELIERGIPRSEYPVYEGESKVGHVTSGTFCPFVEKNLAMALVLTEYANQVEFKMEIRGKRLLAKAVSLPFYSRKRGIKQ